MKKIVLPVILIIVGTGSAFATMMAKKSMTAVNGYKIINTGGGQFTCEDVGQKCSTTAVGDYCRWSSDNNVILHEIDSPETMCGDPLYELPVQ
ncbi:MAG: hypothetical protein BGO40_10695 [Chryseobacterium sp. 39-10]|nr:hypothetical protein [Chryseobacterium sp.]OJV49667.1 MAG: hypothetical protein BGO40_10695 [Chryseobacterium sp. 39-10]